jgi:hypothetical protein
MNAAVNVRLGSKIYDRLSLIGSAAIPPQDRKCLRANDVGFVQSFKIFRLPA